jgi:hypothetical protein
MSSKMDSEDNDFIKVSGLGFSPNQVESSGLPLFYTINDQSGRGQTHLEYLIWVLASLSSPVASVDYKSLTVGSCGEEDGGNCIYVADVGDGKAMDSQGTISECCFFWPAGEISNLQNQRTQVGGFPRWCCPS